MGHEYGNIHRIFMPFFMLFSYFFHAINPMKKAMKNPMKNLLKCHEFTMNLLMVFSWVLSSIVIIVLNRSTEHLAS